MNSEARTALVQKNYQKLRALLYNTTSLNLNLDDVITVDLLLLCLEKQDANAWSVFEKYDTAKALYDVHVQNKCLELDHPNFRVVTFEKLNETNAFNMYMYGKYKHVDWRYHSFFKHVDTCMSTTCKYPYCMTLKDRIAHFNICTYPSCGQCTTARAIELEDNSVLKSLYAHVQHFYACTGKHHLDKSRQNWQKLKTETEGLDQAKKKIFTLWNLKKSHH